MQAITKAVVLGCLIMPLWAQAEEAVAPADPAEAILQATAQALGGDALRNSPGYQIAGKYLDAKGVELGEFTLRTATIGAKYEINLQSAGKSSSFMASSWPVPWNDRNQSNKFEDNKVLRYAGMILNFSPYLTSVDNQNVAFSKTAKCGATQCDVLHFEPTGDPAFDIWLRQDTHLPDHAVIYQADGNTAWQVDYLGWQNSKGMTLPTDLRILHGTAMRYQGIASLLDRNEADVVAMLKETPKYAFPKDINQLAVPFEYENKQIYFKVSVNGKGPFYMLFDSGATTILVKDFAEQLKLGQTGQGVSGGVGWSTDKFTSSAIDLNLNGLKLDNWPVRVIDRNLPCAVAPKDLPCAGSIGGDLLLEVPTTINFDQKTMVFYKPEAVPKELFANASKYPLAMYDHQAVVAGKILSHEARLILDTGAQGNLLAFSNFVDQHNLLWSLKLAKYVGDGWGYGGVNQVKAANIKSISLGDYSFADQGGILLTGKSGLGDQAFAGDALAGIGLLHRFNITFNAKERYVLLEKNSFFDEADAFHIPDQAFNY